jgi:AdoMet-dependent rRNA methyltransferase SPB1
MKTASEHLNKGGVFCTKVYRSVDYNALVWAVQQLFEDVQTMKPSSSRSQSSEIFLICSGFTAPKSVDPKLFDPNYVFKEVADPGLKGPDVLHKKFDQSNKRHRTGYDDSLGITLHAATTVSDFIHSKDPVRMLTDTHEMKFSDNCQQYRDHPKTTEEVKLAVSDLRVLGKIDFKKLLKWRQTMIDTFHPVEEKKPKEKATEEQKPVDIEEEIERLKLEALEKKRKELKKDRKQASKERIRQNLGMNNNAFSADDDAELFSLEKSKITVSDVNLSEDEDFAAAIQDESEEEEDRNDDKLIVAKDNMDDELEDDYVTFLDKRRLKRKVRGEDGIDERTASSKRDAKQKSLETKAKGTQDDDLQVFSDEEDNNDGEDVRTKKFKSAVQGDLEQYLQLLVNKSKSKSKGEEDDVISVDSSDDEEEEVHDLEDDDIGDAKKPAVGKWFDNPLFNKLSSQPKTGRKSSAETKEDLVEKELSMPLTDREKRQEKRRKTVEKQQRKAAAHGASLADDEGNEEEKILGGKRKASAISGSSDFEVVPAETSSLLPRVDPRHYDSEEEDYDAQDRITTLALGTYMLRNSRKKALIDASYNRFSWNDPTGLPSWFMDDEMRHNKPQLPVPQALVDQVRPYSCLPMNFHID